MRDYSHLHRLLNQFFPHKSTHSHMHACMRAHTHTRARHMNLPLGDKVENCDVIYIFPYSSATVNS